jgi:hypothetical protein
MLTTVPSGKRSECAVIAGEFVVVLPSGSVLAVDHLQDIGDFKY